MESTNPCGCPVGRCGLDVMGYVPTLRFCEQRTNRYPGELTEEDAPEKAKTYDEGKAPLAHLPWAAIDEMALVQEYGHAKYKDFYNYKKGMEVSRNISCALRHIREYMVGMDLDAESGRAHLAHAMVRLAYVLQNEADGVAIDDRFSARKK